jgi:hypothetical protein
MRPELPSILRSYANDLGIAGPQFAAMAANLREAADALDEKTAGAAPAAIVVPVLPDDGVPGFGRCESCED